MLIDGWDAHAGGRRGDARRPHRRVGGGAGRTRASPRATGCCGAPGRRSPPSRPCWPCCAAVPSWCRSARRRPPPSSTTSSVMPVRSWRSSTSPGRTRPRPASPSCASTTSAVPRRTPGPVAVPARRPGDDALIVYTSGTTGKPKGAVHTHGSLLAGVSSLLTAWAWTPEDRLVLCLPLFHVHGLCAGLFGTLAAGASAVGVRPLRRGGGPAGGARQHHVLRRPDHVPPAGGDGTGRRAGRPAPVRLGVGPVGAPTCGTSWPPTAWPCWSATA